MPEKIFFAVTPQMVDLFEGSTLYNLMLTQNVEEKVKEERFSELIKMLNLEKACFLKDSDVIILDEPTTALDKITTNNL